MKNAVFPSPGMVDPPPSFHPWAEIVRATKVLFTRAWPLLCGIAGWVTLYFYSGNNAISCRSAGLIAGAVLCAGLLRRQLPPWRSLLVGVIAYGLISVSKTWDDLGFGGRFFLENLADVVLLRRREPVTQIHFVGVAVAWLCFIFWPNEDGERGWRERYTWVAGAYITELKNVFARFAKQSPKPQPGLDLTLLEIPRSWASKNFLFSGIIRCGKTTFLVRLMLSAFRQFHRNSDCRAFVYDYKGEFYPLFIAAGLRVPVRILNPLDRRSVWWDLAREIVDNKTAHQVATALVPDPKTDGESRNAHFFLQKSRGVVAGLLISFQRHSPGRWSFRDVCLALRARIRYEAILRREPDTASLVNSLEHADTSGDVMATLDNSRWSYEIVAACWDQQMRQGNPSFTIREWLGESAVIVLTQDKSGGAILNPIYQALLGCLTDNVASLPDSKTREIWLSADELATLRFSSLPEWLNTCRTKGAVTIAAIQDVSQLFALYGEHKTNSVIAGFDNKIFFKSAVKNAQWATEEFGKAEYFVERKSDSFSVSHGQGGTSNTFGTNTATMREQVPLFRSEFFQYLPTPTPESGFHAAMLLENMAFADSVPFHQAIAPIPAPANVSGYDSVPPEWQVLDDWNSDDLKRLGLDELLEPSNTSQPAKKPSGPKITIKR